MLRQYHSVGYYLIKFNAGADDDDGVDDTLKHSPQKPSVCVCVFDNIIK